MSVYKLKIENDIVRFNNLNNVNTVVSATTSYIRTIFVSGDTFQEIGVVPNNKMIAYIVLEVTTGGTGTANVGTADSQGLLMSINDNDLSIAEKYIVYNNIKTTENLTFNIYFNSNTASGSVTIYYN